MQYMYDNFMEVFHLFSRTVSSEVQTLPIEVLVLCVRNSALLPPRSCRVDFSPIYPVEEWAWTVIAELS